MRRLPASSVPWTMSAGTGLRFSSMRSMRNIGPQCERGRGSALDDQRRAIAEVANRSCVAKCKAHQWVPVRRHAYSAIAMAGLGDLPDTILSRSVIIRMRKRAPEEKVEPYRQRDHKQVGHALRDELAAWAEAIADKAAICRPVLPDGIVDRNADVWEPLIAVADLVGGDGPAGHARQHFSSLLQASQAHNQLRRSIAG